MSDTGSPLPPIRIGTKTVSSDGPVFVIAEAGSNHDGSLDQARCLIDVAAEAGADAVKFQTFSASKIYPRTSNPVEYLKKLGVTKSIYQIIEEMEMPHAWIPKLAEYSKQKGILFMSTPFDEGAVDALDPHVDAFKIASYEMTHLPLIRYAARKQKPIVFSTGAATDLDEVKATVQAIRAEGNDQIVALQCTAKYPAPADAMNLRALATMRRELGVHTGLSDHSREPLTAAVAATALGAVMIEKHYTISRRLPGPDHSFAIEPGELAAMVEAVRGASSMLGSSLKRRHPAENELVNYRRALYTVKDVKKGDPFVAASIAILRKPGVPTPGLPPDDIGRVLGCRAHRDVPAFTLLEEADIQ
jgi:N-acetylneuraminate synthase